VLRRAGESHLVRIRYDRFDQYRLQQADDSSLTPLMTLHCSSQTTNAMSPPWRRELQPTAWLPGCIGGAVLGSAATAVVMRSSPRAHSSRDHSRPHPDVGSLSGAPHTSTAAIRGVSDHSQTGSALYCPPPFSRCR
jgi:hypothetical protein